MASETAFVYKKGQLAATLNRTGNEVRFDYLPAYLAAGGKAVATTLPIGEGAKVLANGAAPAFFAGLLPEGGRLNAIANRIKTSPDNDIALLLEIGADLIGDVQVLPANADPNTERETLLLPSNPEAVEFGKLRAQYFGSRASGIPGVQDKISSKMLNAPARAANIDYILKLNPTDVPFAVENEHYFLGLAKKCGIETAQHQLLTDAVGEHALRLERFDRATASGQKIRLAAEDGCQVLDLYPLQKYEIEFTEMAAKLISLCPARGVAGYSLFKQLVFNWLIGNGDAHAKNFSVLESPAGEWLIAPAYDLLCTIYFEDKTMALPLGEATTGWSRELLIDAAAKMQVPAKAANKVIDKQLLVLANLPDQLMAGVLPYRRDQNIDVAGLLKKRSKRLI